MADITMCDGIIVSDTISTCPFKDSCYRYTAPVNEYRQSYFVTTPYKESTGSCDHYWRNTNASK